jgi:hypothetical protein
VADWVQFVSGGLVALAGVLITQDWTQRREHEGRLWTRREDAYRALMQWRLGAPDEPELADPEDFREASEAWLERGMSVIAGLSVFGGDVIQAALRDEQSLFHLTRSLSALPTRELCQLAYAELSRTRIPRLRHSPLRRAGGRDDLRSHDVDNTSRS